MTDVGFRIGLFVLGFFLLWGAYFYLMPRHKALRLAGWLQWFSTHHPVWDVLLAFGFAHATISDTQKELRDQGAFKIFTGLLLLFVALGCIVGAIFL